MPQWECRLGSLTVPNGNSHASAMTRELRWASTRRWLGGPSRSARLHGRLAVDDDGCVFAARHGGNDCAIAWPMDYEPRVDAGGVLEIVDRSGMVVLRERQAFAAGGGFGPSDDASLDAEHAREVHGRSLFYVGMAVEPE